MLNTQNIGKIENNIVFTEEQVKYVLYARKSTESDELQAMSIDSQIKEMLQLAEREKLLIVDIKRESHSAKASGQRPVFLEILEDLRSGKYTGILTWAPDRLSRNAGDLGSLVDLMDQKKLVHIQTFTQKFTNDPSQKFLLVQNFIDKIDLNKLVLTEGAELARLLLGDDFISYVSRRSNSRVRFRALMSCGG